MADAAPVPKMAAEGYLRWEAEQPERYEYHLGEVFPMAGGSARHAYLCGRCVTRLTLALPDSCRVLSSDMRIAASPGRRYVYADALAVCGALELDPGRNDVLRNPSVVVEVLSPSSERFDRGDKWEAYQQLPSLTDYLLVEQRAARVEHYGRGDSEWTYRAHGAGGSVTLSVGAELSVDELYRGAFDLPGADAPGAG